MTLMPGSEPPEGFEDALAVLHERGEPLEEEFRKLGLYLEVGSAGGADTPMGIMPVLILTAVIGDVAFTGRVQDPETDAFNDQFRVMEQEEGANAFLDERERIRRNIAAGRDALDDGDDES